MDGSTQFVPSLFPNIGELPVDLLTGSYLTLRQRPINASPKLYLVFEETFAQSPLTERLFQEQAEQLPSINKRNSQHSCDLQQQQQQKLPQDVILRPESTDFQVKC